MPRWLRSSLLLAAVLAVLGVYSSYRGVGLLGADLAVLTEAAGGGEASRLQPEPVPLQELGPLALERAAGPSGSFLSGASMALSRRLWGVASSSVVLYRLENLLVLLAAGLGLANLVRRVLIPWTGVEHARAAARALPAVLFLHPLAVHAVLELAGRAELLSLAFGAWSAATFLRSRQDRVPHGLLIAGLLAVAAALSGGSGLGLALGVAMTELFSAHRWRPLSERLRSAALTLVSFALLAGVDDVLRKALGVPTFEGWRVPDVGALAERLGVLVLPVASVEASTGPLSHGLGLALAAVLFLGAMQPALRCARSAPRLWGWLLGSWLVAVLVAGFGALRVTPSSFGGAETLCGGTAVLVAGLAVVATGVQGFRRLVLPVALALGYGVLSLAQAGDWRAAADAVAAVGADLGTARELARTEGFPEAAVLVVDPPLRVGALGPFDDGARPGVVDLGHLTDASLTGRREPLGAPRPRALTGSALLVLAREPEFAALRSAGLVLVVDGAPRFLEVPQPPTVPSPWRSDPRSPELDLGPLDVGALRVLVPGDRPGGDVGLPRAVTFARRRGAAAEGAGPAVVGEGTGLVPGAFARRGERFEGWFDLSGSLEWVLTERVGRMWFEEGLARVEECTFVAALPGAVAGGEGRVVLQRDGRDLVAAIPAGVGEGVVGARGEGDGWVLALLDLDSLEHLELATAEDSGRLRFAEAAVAFDAFGAGAAVWSLECRRAGATIWRHRGRGL